MADIPAILKHTTMAIFSGGSIHGSTRNRFKQAFEIATSQLKKYGHITGGGSNYRLTDKGRARLHGAEGGRGVAKSRMFDELFQQVIEGKEVKPKDPNAEDRSNDFEGRVLGNSGYPKETPHAAEPLYAHHRKPAKRR